MGTWLPPLKSARKAVGRVQAHHHGGSLCMKVGVAGCHKVASAHHVAHKRHSMKYHGEDEGHE